MTAFDPRLIRETPGARRWIVLVVAAGLAGSSFAVAAAWTLSHILADAVQHSARLATLMPLLVVVSLLALARGATMWLSEFAGHAGARLVITDLRARLLRALADGGPALSEGRRTGATVLAATTGIDGLDVYFARYLPQLVLGTAIPVIVLVFLALTDPVSALIVAFTLPLIPLFMWLIGAAAQHRIDKRWSLLQRLSAHFLDVIQGLPTLRIFGRADAQIGNIRDITEASRRATMGTLSIAFLSALVLETLASLATAMVAAAIGVRLVNGTMTLQTGFAVLIAVPEAYMPLRQLGTFFHSSKEGLTAAATVMDIIDAAPTPGRDARVCVTAATDRIDLDDVTCLHGDRGEGIQFPLTVCISPNTTTLVCGASGTGKTTFLSLLLGFVPCTHGTIRVGGIDLCEVDVDDWRRQIGWVAQRPSLFPGTILDNLRLGAPNVSEAEAVSVLTRLFPEGTIGPRSRVQSNGDGLSGGERTRVALARALLRAPSLLLLDEPTSFLDPQAAAAVVSVLREISGTMALVVATHEPERFPWADITINVDVRPLTSLEIGA